MIEYHILLGRKHGSATGYAILASFGDIAPVQRKYAELSGPGVAEFGRENSELLFVSNGVVLANHDWPDPSAVERLRKKTALAAARAIVAANDLAKTEKAALDERLARSRAALKDLTPEQREMLAHNDAAEKMLAAAGMKPAADEAAEAAKSAKRAEAAEARCLAQDAAAAADTAALAPPALSFS